jgi:hypothetical protein
MQPGIIMIRNPQLDEAVSSSTFSRPPAIKKKVNNTPQTRNTAIRISSIVTTVINMA